MQANLAELLESTNARRVLLQLLSPATCRRLLSPEAATVLEPPQRFLAAPPSAAPAAAQLAADAATPPSDPAAEAAGGVPQQPVPLGISKKDPVVRRRELLGSGEGSLAAAMLAAASSAARPLLHGKNSVELLAEAVRGGSDGGCAPASRSFLQ